MSVLTCHCTVGAGAPLAVATNSAKKPTGTVAFEGEEVKVSVGQVEVGAGGFTTAELPPLKFCGRFITAMAVVAVHPWLSVTVMVKTSETAAVKA